MPPSTSEDREDHDTPSGAQQDDLGTTALGTAHEADAMNAFYGTDAEALEAVNVMKKGPLR
jgi:hypothetical protein